MGYSVPSSVSKPHLRAPLTGRPHRHAITALRVCRRSEICPGYELRLLYHKHRTQSCLVLAQKKPVLCGHSLHFRLGQLRLSLQPIFYIVPIFSSALLIKFISPTTNLFVEFDGGFGGYFVPGFHNRNLLLLV